MKMKLLVASFIFVSSTSAFAAYDKSVDESVIAAHREALAKNTENKGFGPQSPRDIDNLNGNNQRLFGLAPIFSQMNLCNIHVHKNAEHKGGEFDTYAGNGDGKGYNSGYVYSGKLSKAELTPYQQNKAGLQSGDTIEVHYVHSSAKVKPGPTLGACLSDSTANPQLRVETQVMVLVNDGKAPDFSKMAEYGQKDGFYQALNIPDNTGKPVQYAGSTTGPGYNEKGSPFQVTWSVRPKVVKVDIDSVANWLTGNDFDEKKAHGVRNLIINPDLLSSGH